MSTPQPSNAVLAAPTEGAERTDPAVSSNGHTGFCVPSASGRVYWNEQGQRFARSFFGAPTTTFYLEEEQRLLERHLSSLDGKKLLKLDLWNEAQNTEILFWAARQGAICYSLDIAETTATKARLRSRELNLPIRIVVADALTLPFPSESFDCLYTMGTLEHLPRPEAAFAELARVLKPNGVAIVGVPNRRDPFLFSVTSRLLQAFDRYPYGYECWYTNGELRLQLEAQGLRVVQRDAILFLPWALRFLDVYLWLRSPWACRLTGLLLKPFRALSRLRWLVRRFGYLTVCVVRK
jgi:SAM-dependent methyltransferase